jgi:UDP-N-acetylmuramoyl-tripeptide--D-alanyl-D-alanine ligase
MSHVGTIGGPESIAREKASIFGALGEGGVAVLPEDPPWAPVLRASVPAGVRTVSFGTGAACEARLIAVEPDGDGSIVSATIDGMAVRFALRAPGTHMARNAVAALAVACACGVEPERAAGGLGAFRAGAGRGLTRPILGGRAILLDESYNASGASVRAALEVLALLPASRRVAVLGDMLELGEWSAQEHRSLAEPAAARADLVFCCGRWSRELHEALPPSARGGWAPDAAALAPEVVRSVRVGDAVLVKGSNGSRMRLVVEALLGAGEPGDGNA